MKTHTSMPVWAQWAAGVTLLTVAIVAGATGLVLNVRHGLEAGIAPAIAYGLADIGKLIIPMACVWIGWNMRLKLTCALCVATSIWCATNAWLDFNARKASAGEQQATIWNGAKADADRIRADLAAISETGTSASLLEAARQANARADDEKKNGGCLKRCLDARNDAGKLTERAGVAERRERLEGQLREVKVEATASGGPAAVRGNTGIVDAVLFLGLIEGLVWLNMTGMGMLQTAMAGRAKPKAKRETKVKAEAKPKATRRLSGRDQQASLRKSRAKPRPVAIDPVTVDRSANLDRIMLQVAAKRRRPVAVN